MTTWREALAGTTSSDAATRVWLLAHRPAWYVDAVVGAGLWVGAGLFAVFLALAGLIDEPVVCVLLGLVGLVGAAVAARGMPTQAHIGQATFVVVVVASSLVLGGAVLVERDFDLVAETLTVLGAGVLAAVPGRATRFSAVVALGVGAALVASKAGPGAMEMLQAFWCAVTTALWLLRPRLLGIATQLVRVGSFAFPVVAVGTWFATARVLERGEPVPETAAAEVVVTVVLGLGGVATAWRAWREQRAPIAALVIGLVTAVIVAVVGRNSPLVPFGVVLCALAVIRRDLVLQGFGITVLLVGVGWMLWVDGSLSGGALTCFGIGTALLVARAALLVVVPGDVPPTAPSPEGSIRSPLGVRPSWLTREGVALAASVLLSIGVVFALTVQREALHARGTTILLPLRPVDPRSILQGDYMTLDYVAARAIGTTDTGDGVAIFTVDSDRVATFAREDDDTPLSDREVRVRFRRRDGRVVFGAETFLFEEGQGQHFARARYAELRVDDGGAILLVDLRDAGRVTLKGDRR